MTGQYPGPDRIVYVKSCGGPVRMLGCSLLAIILVAISGCVLFIITVAGQATVSPSSTTSPNGLSSPAPKSADDCKSSQPKTFGPEALPTLPASPESDTSRPREENPGEGTASHSRAPEPRREIV